MQRFPIKNILVPLDLSPFTDAAASVACSIAKHHHAQVDGIVVLDLPEIMGQELPYTGWLVPDSGKITAERKAAAEQRIQDALNHFTKLCEPHNIPHSASEMQGIPADCILESACLHDLVVMGLRTFFSPDNRGDSEDSLTAVLRSPNAPVLAVPKAECFPADWKKVLIAYDGSPNSSRALKEFVRFAQQYHFEITILTSSKETARAEASLNAAAAYLNLHELNNVRTVVTSKDIMEVINDDYIAVSDLIVAGTHSRKFIKDIFVGSLTRSLIDYGHTPLFLS